MTDDFKLEDDEPVTDPIEDPADEVRDTDLDVDDAQVADAPQPHPMTPGLGVVGKFTVPAQAVNGELTTAGEAGEQ